ncbi:hypothetical protein V1281_001492 [Nitrobacteraceae bacterium AZCC 2161]
MALPLNNRIADVLLADGARPFDSVIKQILGRPKVLLRLCKDHVGKGEGYLEF